MNEQELKETREQLINEINSTDFDGAIVILSKKIKGGQTSNAIVNGNYIANYRGLCKTLNNFMNELIKEISNANYGTAQEKAGAIKDAIEMAMPNPEIDNLGAENAMALMEIVKDGLKPWEDD